MKQKKEPYLVFALMIIFTFALAFILVYFSSQETSPVEANISSQPTSSIEQPSKSVSTTTTSSDIKTSSTASSKEDKNPVSFKKFTEDEINQINNIIKASENLRYAQNETENESSDTSSKEIIKVPANVSIYFEDIQSGYKYTFNEEHKYFIASIIKAPYCMYLYTLAEQGKCDLNEKHTIEFDDIQEGTGKLKDLKEEEFPLSMSVRELISYAIRYSDNTAMEALRKHYNHIGYQEYAKSLGLNYLEDISYIVNGRICAKDVGIYNKALYNYIENGKYGNELKVDMQNTTNKMIYSKYPIARKYGWAKESFHDMAIIYSPHPYILTILSDNDGGRKQDYQLFYNISSLIEKFQEKRYTINDN